VLDEVFVPRPETEMVAQVAIDEAARVRALGASPLVVDLCCGSGVIGISVDEPRSHLQKRIAALANQAAERLGQNVTVRPEEIEVEDAWAAPGYGVLTEAESEAIRLFARQEGLLLDPVYTARAAAGLLGLIRKGMFTPGQSVLFWHTGGTPALFASRYSGIVNDGRWTIDSGA
ncbi:MAG: hypothetical protein ACK8QZ_07460, partial [Anaerolineales bacterium]